MTLIIFSCTYYPFSISFISFTKSLSTDNIKSFACVLIELVDFLLLSCKSYTSQIQDIYRMYNCKFFSQSLVCLSFYYWHLLKVKKVLKSGSISPPNLLFFQIVWLLGHVYFHVNFNTNLSTSTLKKSLVEFDQNWDEFIDQFGRTVLLKSTVFSNLFAIATSLNLFRL